MKELPPRAPVKGLRSYVKVAVADVRPRKDMEIHRAVPRGPGALHQIGWCYVKVAWNER